MLEDNFPTTNLEAQACGTPTITFNTGGSIESVDKDCGYVVEKGNIHEILDRVNTMKVRGKASYTENCVKHAREFYDKEERFMEYLNLYRSISR